MKQTWTEDSHLHTHHRENIKSYLDMDTLQSTSGAIVELFEHFFQTQQTVS
jgi:hypothetical protein